MTKTQGLEDIQLSGKTIKEQIFLYENLENKTSKVSMIKEQLNKANKKPVVFPKPPPNNKMPLDKLLIPPCSFKTTPKTSVKPYLSLSSVVSSERCDKQSPFVNFKSNTPTEKNVVYSEVKKKKEKDIDEMNENNFKPQNKKNEQTDRINCSVVEERGECVLGLESEEQKEKLEEVFDIQTNAEEDNFVLYSNTNFEPKDSLESDSNLYRSIKKKNPTNDIKDQKGEVPKQTETDLYEEIDFSRGKDVENPTYKQVTEEYSYINQLNTKLYLRENMLCEKPCDNNSDDVCYDLIAYSSDQQNYAALDLTQEKAEELLKTRKKILTEFVNNEECFSRKLLELQDQLKATTSYKCCEELLFNITKLTFLNKKLNYHLHKVLQDKKDSVCVSSYIEEYIKGETDMAERYVQLYLSFIEESNQTNSRNSDELSQACQRLSSSLISPINNIQNHYNLLEALLNSTPPSHPDHVSLKRTLDNSKSFFNSQLASSDHLKPDPIKRCNSAQNSPTPLNFLTSKLLFSSTSPSSYFVRQGLVVELVHATQRKLRVLFLFSDFVACAKAKDKYVLQWYVPVWDLKVTDAASSVEGGEEKVEELRRGLRCAQKEFKSRKTRAFPYIKDDIQRRNLAESIKQKEQDLILNLPNLKLTLTRMSANKSMTLLMTSQFERGIWKGLIDRFALKALPFSKLSSNLITFLINKHKPDVSKNVKRSKKRINGSLKVTVHRLQTTQVEPNEEVYCTVESDSFGHLLLKARTNTIPCSNNAAVWNEDFEIDLHGTQLMRVFCFKTTTQSTTTSTHNEQKSTYSSSQPTTPASSIQPLSSTTTHPTQDELLGSFNIEFSEEVLQKASRNQWFSFGFKMKLEISFEYVTYSELRNKTLTLKNPSDLYFAVPLGHVIKKDGTKVPVLLSACIEEVEKRGLREVGLYRISGLYSSVSKLKTSFNKLGKTAADVLKHQPTHVLTGLVKLFLRELPEPIISHQSYPFFARCLDMTAEQLQEGLESSLKQLQPPHLHTLLLLLKHLHRVAQLKDTNQMDFFNLATVFAPNVMQHIEQESIDLATETVLSNKNSKILLNLLNCPSLYL